MKVLITEGREMRQPFNGGRSRTTACGQLSQSCHSDKPSDAQKIVAVNTKEKNWQNENVSNPVYVWMVAGERMGAEITGLLILLSRSALLHYRPKGCPVPVLRSD